ncbi:hypothetical protein BGP_3705 [Beggiatoa sp. PS]|nr:hypothetical protein BGP_3705 [Beggiatoa sp. PS]
MLFNIDKSPTNTLQSIPTIGVLSKINSVERLQVKLTGLTDSRYVLVCNGRWVPLHNTGTQRGICGWYPLSGLATAFSPTSDDSG